MHKVLGAGNVAGRYVAGNPQTGQRPTALDARDLNTLFAEMETLVQAAGLTLNSLDDTQVLRAVQTISVGRSALRNALLNGDFMIMQRDIVGAVSTNDTGAFGPDRWLVNNNNGASGSITINQENYGGGAIGTDWPYPNGRSKGLITCAGTSLPNPMLLMQRIEDVRTLSNAQATLSFWVKASGTVTITPKLRQYHGSGGAADVTTSLDPITLAAGVWTRYEHNVTVPAVGLLTNTGWPRISGGWSASVGHYSELRLEISGWSGASCTLEMLDVQVEPGVSAGTFERRPYDFELQLCQRYYEKTLEAETGIAYFQANFPLYAGCRITQGSGTIAAGLDTRFRVRKAKVPTIRWYSPETGAIDTIRWNAVEKTVDATLFTTTENTGHPQVTGSSTNTPIYAHWTADAEL